jgi:hypothetical protein
MDSSQFSVQWVLWAFSMGLKQPELKAYFSPNFEVKNISYLRLVSSGSQIRLVKNLICEPREIILTLRKVRNNYK